MKTSYRYPYEVLIRRGSENPRWFEGFRKDAEEWIYENCSGDWNADAIWKKVGRTPSGYWNSELTGWRFWFEKRDEALLFKLIHGA
jgi:hypothetical protein